ncbi:hypothetical protein [Halomonas litopenaei]|uniref:hypothetical protein n=1 Tax=Halomonas litopenaei TaxID=2109328 RepID=UPI003FA06BE8
MKSNLCDEISDFSQGHPAIYIGKKTLTNIATHSLSELIRESIGKTISIPTLPPFAVRLESVKTSNNEKEITTNISISNNSEIQLKTQEELTLNFSFGAIAEDSLLELSLLNIRILDLKFSISSSSEKITATPGDAKVIPELTRETDFLDNIKKLDLDIDMVTRVEGMLLYSSLATAITKTVSNGHEINIRNLFPSIIFNGRVELSLSWDEEYIFITGSHGASLPISSCDCSSHIDGIGPVKPGEVIVGESTETKEPPNDSVGSITIGGPSPVKPSYEVIGNSRKGHGDTGLFLSYKTLENIVDGTFPGARLDLSQNTFIGWKAAVFIDFNELKFSPDPNYGRFYVELSFRVEVYGSVHVDLGKLGKIRVTNFSAEQKSAGDNSVTIGCYPVIGSNGIFLKPVLEEVNFNDFDVFLRLGSLAGTPFGGWGAVTGYIFDEILSKIIGYLIPIHLDLELRKYMGKLTIPLLDAYYAANIAGILNRKSSHSKPLLVPLYEGGKNGFLFSTGLDG